jgi:hypothetical protein
MRTLNARRASAGAKTERITAGNHWRVFHLLRYPSYGNSIAKARVEARIALQKVGKLHLKDTEGGTPVGFYSKLRAPIAAPRESSPSAMSRETYIHITIINRALLAIEPPPRADVKSIP